MAKARQIKTGWKQNARFGKIFPGSRSRRYRLPETYSPFRCWARLRRHVTSER